MASYILPGREINTGGREELPEELSGILKVSVVSETQAAQSRGESGPTKTKVSGIEPDDIIEIQLENGLKLWHSVADAQADYGGVARSIDDQALLIPRNLPISRNGARDVGSYAVQTVKIIKTSFAGKAGEITAFKIAQHIESSLTTGFFKCSRSEDLETPEIVLGKVNKSQITSKKKMLVLVHGTFSSTNGSFADLLGPPYGDDDLHGMRPDADPLWDALEADYPAGIYALEHRSVTIDPVANALDLIDALPNGANVTLMSHSRGGLVAELIARASRKDPPDGNFFDDLDYRIFSNDGRSSSQLEKLNTALKDKAITVERLIRVAGPLRGTSLASKRLDRFLSIALNAFELVPALRISPAYSMFKAFLIGFVKTKADPEKLPGLEAMMPSSPLVRMLNRQDIACSSDLHIIAGDNEGKGILRRLRNLAFDLFFQDENDFVVNYRSMSRGAARDTKPTLTQIIDAEITHFSYFRTEQARIAIRAASNPPPQPLIEFPFDPVPKAFPASPSRSDEKLPVCILLPGIMGSHLHQDNDWIWTNPLRMATGGLQRLAVPDDGVRAGEPMEKYYGDLAKFLARTHHVIPFAYDWRLSVIETGATVLARIVERELNRTDQPIRFVAHSMGGLVVRAFIDAHPALWARIKHRNKSRFVMLGTPNGGAFSMMHTMMGRSKAIKQLAALDFAHSKQELLGIVSSMPGPIQLLPSDQNCHYLNASVWTELHNLENGDWAVPSSAVFEMSRRAHKLFATQPLDPEMTCYVAGLGVDPTPCDIRITPAASGSKRIQFLATYHGDGTVTWATGIPDGIRPYYMPVVHGDLARTTSAFPAILDLLERGETSALSQTPPALERGTAEIVTLPEPELDIFPDPEDVVDSIMGASTSTASTQPRATGKTDVTLVHGDLRYARFPVLTGHYDGDPIGGAEAALDQCLGFHLSAVRDMGLYPGEIETCEVILRLDQNPGGALIAGLGNYGDLTPGRLRKTINRAVLRYALILRRRAQEDGKTLAQMDPITLTSLVIGHKGANMTVQQSVQAILEAVADANRTMHETPIAQLQFVELFEDTAFNAASALRSVTLNGQIKGAFHFDDAIKTGDGARLRMDFGVEPDTWQRIKVTRHPTRPDILNFTAITDGAKADFQMTTVQPDVLERLLKESREGTATDRNLGKLLFELMIPMELKSFAKDDQKILLILDETTSAYPWELMEDDISTFGGDLYQPTGKAGFKPLVIRTPIIRQLAITGNSVPRTQTRTALVVGDPMSKLPALPGAQAEAELVADKLKNSIGYEVNYLHRPADGISVLEATLLAPSKIMHFAAHGIYDDTTEPHTSGIIISDGVYLTASEIGQMRYVPEFVFLNCCHVGRAEGNAGTIAASLSEALIRKGVRAVIAAGWAVNDPAALLFADEFYSSLLNGNSFGDAVHHARLAVFAKYPDTNTWGAYQCYGDPEYRIDERAEETDDTANERHFFSSEHATKAAINISRDAASSHQNRDNLIAQLRHIERCARSDWYSDATWCEWMGRAYARLDIHASAIEMLERAVCQSRSNSSINSIELLEDLRVKAATYEWIEAQKRADKAQDEDRPTKKDEAKRLKARQRNIAKTALDVLNTLDSIVGSKDAPIKTARRELIKGTVSKRLFLTSSTRKQARQKALERMVDHYEASMEIAGDENIGFVKPHPAFNWLSGNVALGSLTPKGEPIETWFTRILAENAKLENTTPSFWTAALPAEIEILRGLLVEDVDHDASFQEFEKLFSFALGRGAAYSQVCAIREHVHFLQTVFDSSSPQKAAWMARIKAYLDALS